MNIQFPNAPVFLPATDNQISTDKDPASPHALSFKQALADASGPDKIAGAAKQFEALIAGQVLKVAREASEGGWLGSEDDQAGELALEMAEQSFAQAMASRGGFGIAKIVTDGFARSHAKAASSESQTPHPADRQSTNSPIPQH